ncbi:MAG TPA: prephenate dehydrogenase/arogenate dehydrogenase family protein, partial [Phenylobacterium sp.]|nr:prephenate dehydrogenase/arogenate dehydrogenase family protein [Phenylobacterium sp.]
MELDLPVFDKLAIIGCGLIGSSVARGARASGAVRTIAIHDASPAARETIARLGLADQVTDTAAEAVQDADLVIFATPVRAMGEAARACAGAMKAGAVISDVGSVKAAVSACAARPCLAIG